MNETTDLKASPDGQAGGGMLTIVAVLGLLLTLVQGTVYYRAKESARYLRTEKNKVLAMQMAEAGVENNVADFGRGTTVVQPGQSNVITYDHKALEGGFFTSKYSTVDTGAAADTVDLTSTGLVGTTTQSIQTRLRLQKNITVATVMMPTIVNLDPFSLPIITNAVATSPVTPLSTACLSAPGNPTCFVCHWPPTDPSQRHVISGSRSSILGGHANHQGDYITTSAAGCSSYNPTVTWTPTPTTTTTITTQTLSWK